MSGLILLEWLFGTYHESILGEKRLLLGEPGNLSVHLEIIRHFILFVLLQKIIMRQ